MLAGALQEILLRNIRLQRFSWDWPAGTVLKTQWGAVGKDPKLPSYSSGPAVLSLKYLTSSRETKMDLAKAFQVRSPKSRHTACLAVTFHKKQLLCIKSKPYNLEFRHSFEERETQVIKNSGKSPEWTK